MHIIRGIILAFAICWSVYHITLSIARKRRQARKAKELGCQRAPRFPADPLGYQFLTVHLEADAEDRMPAFQSQRFEWLSEQLGRPAHTMEVILPPAVLAFCTFEPENIKAMLATQFNDFQLPRNRINGFEPLLGQGIFLSNGARWEHSRALLRPQFARQQMAEAATEQRHLDNLIRAIGPVDADGWTEFADLQPLFFRMALDNATQFLFGHSVDSQLAAISPIQTTSLERKRDEDFTAAWDRAQNYLMKASRYGAMYRVAHYSGGRDFFHCCKRVREFTDFWVQNALRKQQSRLGEAHAPEKAAQGKQKYVFLDALVQETQDPKELRFQSVNMLLAGRDTTASLLGWVFRELSLNQEVFKKLRHTILEDFGQVPDKNITFETLKNCQYLTWVLNETLRVYPVLPLNSRQATRDTSLPTGGGPDGKSPVFIPEGSEIMFSVHVMHHRKDLWGSDASAWKPERWANKRPGWEFLPFNGGPRICLGQQYALAEAGYAVVRLLQEFDEIDGSKLDPDVVKNRLNITSSPGDGVQVRLRRSSKSGPRPFSA